MQISLIKPHKKLDIEFWQMVFRYTWAYLVPVLGVSNVYGILNQSLTQCKQNNKILEHVRILADGVDLDFLKEEDSKKEETLLALRNFLSEILNTLAVLSGKKVSDQVRNIVNKLLKQKISKSRVLCFPDSTEKGATCFSFDF